MLKFVRVVAGADPEFDAHLAGVLEVYHKAFEFYPAYAEKIAAMAHGNYPPGAEAIILAAFKKEEILGFTLSYYFADLKAGYLDYIASDPGRASRGIGGAIYETMRDDLKKRGARRLFFESLPDEPGPHVNETLIPINKKRLAFYERLGARPVLGTAFEKTVTSYNLGDPGFLMHDAMANPSPLSRAKLKAVLQRILVAKTGLAPDSELIKSIVDSAKDDPVVIRPPRYVTASRTAPPKFTRPVDLVVTADEAPSIEHSPFRGYYERPARVSAIRRALEGLPVQEHKAAQWGIDHIEAVHDRRMVAFLRESEKNVAPKRILYPEIFPVRFADRLPRNWDMRAGYFCMDTSTPITNLVYRAARRAVDAALTGAKLVAEEKTSLSYVVVRPPGHHAEHKVFGGFCYFNNAAIAANFLAGRGKVAMLDIDHHHGNGAQDIFYERADVLTASIHGHPISCYPFYAGFADETGAGAGKGFNHNFPLHPGVDDAGYLTVLKSALKQVRAFKPRYLVICLGLDIMKGDPTGDMFITVDGMRVIGAEIGALGMPTLVIQEGGYNLSNLRRGVRAFISGLAAAHERRVDRPA
ncbi:MAG: histone deacetylase family protein [Parvularculaceae bacterium]